MPGDLLLVQATSIDTIWHFEIQGIENDESPALTICGMEDTIQVRIVIQYNMVVFPR